MNLIETARFMRIGDVQIVEQLIREGLLRMSVDGQISASDAHGFLHSSRMSSLLRIRREVAAAKAAADAEEQKQLDKRAALVERLQTATMDGDVQTAKLAYEALELLNTPVETEVE